MKHIYHFLRLNWLKLSFILQTRITKPTIQNTARSNIHNTPSLLQKILGRLLRASFNFRERQFHWRYSLRQLQTSYRSMVGQSILFALGFLSALLLIMLFGLGIDYLLVQVLKHFEIHTIASSNIFPNDAESVSPLSESMLQLTEVYAGTIAAILGIIFALYIVVLELSSNYSHDVAQYINSEPGGKFFFKVLVFTLLYDVFVLLRIHAYSDPPIATFLFATALTVFSFITLIVYRDHHLLASQPKNLFGRLRRDYNNKLNIVINQKIAWHKSRSLNKLASNDIYEYVTLVRQLYFDLLDKNDVRNAAFAPLMISSMLQKYIMVKHHIGIENVYWFRSKRQPLSNDSFLTSNIADYYSRSGIGTVTVPTSDREWLENMLLETLSEMTKGVQNFTSERRKILLSGILSGYNELLVSGGIFDQSRRESLFELQDFKVFESTLNQFFALWKYAKEFEQTSLEYLGIVQYVGLIILKGFDHHEVEKASNHLFSNKEIHHNKPFPAFIQEIIDNYKMIIEAELEMEGKLITPPEYITNNILEEILKAEANNIGNFFPRILAHSQICRSDLKDNSDAPYQSSLRLQLLWLKYMFNKKDLKRELFLSQFVEIGVFEADAALVNLLTNLDIENNDIRNDLEHLLLFALFARSKQIYQSVLTYRSLLYITTHNKIDFSNRKHGLIIRSLLVDGALSFAISELDQDYFWVEEYTDTMKKLFGDFVGLLTILANSNGSDYLYTIDEDYLYQEWFASFEKELDELQIQHIESSIIGHIEYIHASEFIRSLPADEHLSILRSTKEHCIEGYTEWLTSNIK